MQLDANLKCILFGVIFTVMSNIFPRSNEHIHNLEIVINDKITTNRFKSKTIIPFGW